MDPHLKVETEEENPFASKFPNKPPSFETLNNNVKAVTKKFEVIKGMQFELTGALSNNFHMSHIWNLPYKTIIP